MKVLIAEPVEICRFALKTLIFELHPDTIFFEAAESDQLKSIISSKKPDFVIIEPSQFLKSDSSILSFLHRTLPLDHVLVISSKNSSNYFTTLSSTDHLSFFLKECSLDEQKSALRNFLSEKVSRDASPHIQSNTPLIPGLTSRESEILSLIAESFTANEIASQLYISHHTAQRHRKNILKKLGLKGTAELVRYYLDHKK